MRLIDYLIGMLEAQGEVLRGLNDIFGTDVLFEVLEVAGEKHEQKAQSKSETPLTPFRFHKSVRDVLSPYEELETVVHKIKLPSQIEFHLWAYPPYRALIESAENLSALFPNERDYLESLIAQSSEQNLEWVKSLSLPEKIQEKVLDFSRASWKKFRVKTLKTAGFPPLQF